jgi:hypothetical protein
VPHYHYFPKKGLRLVLVGTFIWYHMVFIILDLCLLKWK